MFQVQRTPCTTCIYRTGSPLDLARLEAEIADPRMAGYFVGFRECHHASPGSGICCAGFFARHAEDFTAGQLAVRLGLIAYVTVDVHHPGQEPGKECQ